MIDVVGLWYMAKTFLRRYFNSQQLLTEKQIVAVLQRLWLFNSIIGSVSRPDVDQCKRALARHFHFCVIAGHIDIRRKTNFALFTTDLNYVPSGRKHATWDATLQYLYNSEGA